MGMEIITSKGLLFGSKVNLIRPDAVVAEWTHRSIVPNEQFLYIAAKYVEADKANENKHFWSFEALQESQSTIKNSPINVMHQHHNIVGVMTDSEMIYPDAWANESAEARDFSREKRDELAKQGKAMSDGSYPIENEADLKNAIQAYGRASNKAATKKHILKRARALGATDLLPDDWKSASSVETAVGDDRLLAEAVEAELRLEETGHEYESTALAYFHAKPYVEMLGALWKWYYPQTVAQIEAAQEMGALWVSMECAAETVTRVDNDGTETNYPFMGGNIKAYDFHADSSHVQLNKPHFVGCGLVLPPAKPGWKGAEVRELMAAISEDEQELVYNQFVTAAPHLSPEQWEDLMIAVLAKTPEGVS